MKFGPSPPANCKPHYRAARAAIALGKYSDAKRYAAEGLAHEPENALLRKIFDSAESKRKVEAKKRAAREREQWKRKKVYSRARNACRRRCIQVGPLTMDIERYTSQSASGMIGGAPLPVVSKDERDNNLQPMSWSVLFIYPEHAQTDFVSSFADDMTFREQLSCMFPGAPWDERGDYTVNDLDVFFEERYVAPYDMSRPWEGQYEERLEKQSELVDYSKKHWVRVHLDCMLGEMLMHPGYVVPGIPIAYIVSRKSDYYATFLEGTKGATVSPRTYRLTILNEIVALTTVTYLPVLRIFKRIMH